MNVRRRTAECVHVADPGATSPAVADTDRSETYLRLLEDLLCILPARLEESQLPIHILLESPFGELNENQEELLGAARNAIEAADIEVRRLRKLLDLERGAVRIGQQPMGVAELLRAPLAIAAARADKAGVSYRWNVPIELPRVLVDPAHMPEALTSQLGIAIGRTAPGGTLLVDAREVADGARVAISMSHGDGATTLTADGLLATRTIELQGGTIADGAHATVIELRAERLGASTSATVRTSGPRE